VTPPPVDAVLLDVGGTLWPNEWPRSEHDADEQSARLVAIAADTCGMGAVRLLAARLEEVPDPADGGPQLADRTVAGIVEALGLGAVFPDPPAVRRAVCLPAAGHLDPLPGAAGLLRAARDGGVRAVLVSNTRWRDAAAYLADFEGLGLGDCLSGAVTSVDVGHRKPHAAVFAAALGLAGCPPDRCVMVGDSEACDVEPARRLGMRTVRVAVEQPAPVTSAADVVTGSLGDVARLIRGWDVQPPPG